mmetsp:Transcript_30437/g.66804  ORF Transcript_30437/g.66804 Transcript_30437/m.66804 type:complete len:203 (+) Transcript_30437:328-936(+)
MVCWRLLYGGLRVSTQKQSCGHIRRSQFEELYDKIRVSNTSIAQPPQPKSRMLRNTKPHSLLRDWHVIQCLQAENCHGNSDNDATVPHHAHHVVPLPDPIRKPWQCPLAGIRKLPRPCFQLDGPRDKHDPRDARCDRSKEHQKSELNHHPHHVCNCFVPFVRSHLPLLFDIADLDRRGWEKSGHCGILIGLGLLPFLVSHQQ